MTVELDSDLAGTSPTWKGELISVGQVGSLVRIPQGPISLLASVLLVGIASSNLPADAQAPVAAGKRWMEVELLGELTGTTAFDRGVGSYPSLDDSVHFVTSSEIHALFPTPNSQFIGVGSLSSASATEVTIDLEKLVTRHSLIVGSTGAGKSSAAASLLQAIATDDRPSAKVLVFDAHGEYEHAFPGRAIYSTLEAGELTVPLWLLPADEIYAVLTGGSDNGLAMSKFRELVLNAKRSFANAVGWAKPYRADINPDTPLPFDVRQTWFDFDVANRGVYSGVNGTGHQEVDELGDARSLKPTRFKPYGIASQAPYRSPEFDRYGNIPDRMRETLADPRLSFLVDNPDQYSSEDPLPAIVVSWLGDKQISVVNLNGLPPSAAEIAIGAVLRVCYELTIWAAGEGIGASRPLLLVIEEAHRYLEPDNAVGTYARSFVNRIAREGRKYGLGLMLLSQRPSELPRTAISQIGTFIALRLNNGADQATIKAAMPDGSGLLADALPSLRTGEAIFVGEAIRLPSRVGVRRASPAPSGIDAQVSQWATNMGLDFVLSIRSWRNRKKEEL